MAYTIKYDGNYNPIEVVDELVPIFVDTTSTGEKLVDVPSRSFIVGIKRCGVDAEISINNQDYFPIDEGDQFGKFRSLDSIKIKVNAVGTDPIILLFSI